MIAYLAGRPAPTGEDNSALRGFRALQLEFGIQLTGEAGPMRFDMLQPKELKKWPLCPACIQAYDDPPGLEANENHHYGYAIPTRAKRVPKPAPVT